MTPDHDQLRDRDWEAFAAHTADRLPPHHATAAALESAAARRGEETMRSRSARFLAGATAVAVAAAVVLCPVPYTRTDGWDVSLRAADGHAATVHLPKMAADEASRRASALAARSGGTATVTPHTEKVWGTVYAAAREALVRIDVATEGKSPAQIEDEIRAQLAAQGWTPGDVVVERSEDGSSVRIAGSADGKRMEVVERSLGEPLPAHIAVQVDPFDTTRDPGMTDAELKAKIERQLEAKGMHGEVTIDGNRVMVRAEKESHTSP